MDWERLGWTVGNLMFPKMFQYDWNRRRDKVKRAMDENTLSTAVTGDDEKEAKDAMESVLGTAYGGKGPGDLLIDLKAKYAQLQNDIDYLKGQGYSEENDYQDSIKKWEGQQQQIHAMADALRNGTMVKYGINLKGYGDGLNLQQLKDIQNNGYVLPSAATAQFAKQNPYSNLSDISMQGQAVQTAQTAQPAAAQAAQSQNPQTMQDFYQQIGLSPDPSFGNVTRAANANGVVTDAQGNVDMDATARNIATRVPDNTMWADAQAPQIAAQVGQPRPIGAAQSGTAVQNPNAPAPANGIAPAPTGGGGQLPLAPARQQFLDSLSQQGGTAANPTQAPTVGGNADGQGLSSSNAQPPQGAVQGAQDAPPSGGTAAPATDAAQAGDSRDAALREKYAQLRARKMPGFQQDYDTALNDLARRIARQRVANMTDKDIRASLLAQGFHNDLIDAVLADRAKEKHEAAVRQALVGMAQKAGNPMQAAAIAYAGLASPDPKTVLDYLKGTASDRGYYTIDNGGTNTAIGFDKNNYGDTQSATFKKTASPGEIMRGQLQNQALQAQWASQAAERALRAQIENARLKNADADRQERAREANNAQTLKAAELQWRMTHPASADGTRSAGGGSRSGGGASLADKLSRSDDKAARIAANLFNDALNDVNSGDPYDLESDDTGSIGKFSRYVSDHGDELEPEDKQYLVSLEYLLNGMAAKSNNDDDGAAKWWSYVPVDILERFMPNENFDAYRNEG